MMEATIGRSGVNHSIHRRCIEITLENDFNLRILVNLTERQFQVGIWDAFKVARSSIGSDLKYLSFGKGTSGGARPEDTKRSNRLILSKLRTSAIKIG